MPGLSQQEDTIEWPNIGEVVSTSSALSPCRYFGFNHIVERIESGSEKYKDMLTERHTRLCPVERAGSLDNRVRRWLQNPRKILMPYIEKGMSVLDLGCGPGFFSIDMARMVGKSGHVISCDLQEGMLQKLKNKIRGTELDDRITLHKCQKDKIGVSAHVDLVLAFYMVHEVSDQVSFFYEIASILKPNGRLFIVEPPFHVSKAAFEVMITKATDAGLRDRERPKVLFSKAVILEKE